MKVNEINQEFIWAINFTYSYVYPVNQKMFILRYGIDAWNNRMAFLLDKQRLP